MKILLVSADFQIILLDF